MLSLRRIDAAPPTTSGSGQRSTATVKGRGTINLSLSVPVTESLDHRDRRALGPLGRRRSAAAPTTVGHAVTVDGWRILQGSPGAKCRLQASNMTAGLKRQLSITRDSEPPAGSSRQGLGTFVLISLSLSQNHSIRWRRRCRPGRRRTSEQLSPQPASVSKLSSPVTVALSLNEAYPYSDPGVIMISS